MSSVERKIDRLAKAGDEAAIYALRLEGQLQEMFDREDAAVADRDALKAELEELRDALKVATEALDAEEDARDDAEQERDALKAALEATADALREWQGFGRVPGGGYNGDLPVRTESALLVAEALLADTEEKP